MPSCHEKDILNNVIFAFKMSLLSEKHLTQNLLLHQSSIQTYNFFYKLYYGNSKEDFFKGVPIVPV